MIYSDDLQNIFSRFYHVFIRETLPRQCDFLQFLIGAIICIICPIVNRKLCFVFWIQQFCDWKMYQDWDSRFVNDTTLSFANPHLSLSSTCLPREILGTITQSVGFGFPAKQLDLKLAARSKMPTLDKQALSQYFFLRKSIKLYFTSKQSTS